MKYLIVEDERFAFVELKRMMEQLRPDYTWVGRTESVADTVLFLKNNPVELILLDIRLADGNSFEIFEQIQVTIPIIFTTAYDEYAIQAFKLNSIDYLLKPVEEEDLLAALNKLERQQEKREVAFDYKKLGQALIGSSKKDRFLVQFGDSYNFINVNDIAFFYSEDKVVFLHTFSGKKYIIDYALTQLESQLDDKMFFRLSRGIIANINAIKKADKYFNSRLKITLNPDFQQEVLVSRERVPEFLNWIDGWN